MLNHHQGLPDDQVRDLIARTIKPAAITGFWSKNDDYERMLVERVEKAVKELEGYRLGRSMRQIAEQFGWDAFDVSEYVAYDKDTYVDFVGTREELAQIYPEKAEELENR